MLEVILFSALAIVVGLAFCFMGYQLFRFLLPIWAFLIGLWLGGVVLAGAIGGGFFATSLGLVVGFVVGILFAALAYFVYSLAVLLFGATVGFAIGQGLILLLGFNQGLLSWTAGIAVAVIFVLAFAVLKFPKVIIMVLTGFAGAMAAISGLFILFGSEPASQLGMIAAKAQVQSSVFWLIVWVVLSLLGIFFQYALTKEKEVLMAETIDPEELMVVEVTPASKKK